MFLLYGIWNRLITILFLTTNVSSNLNSTPVPVIVYIIMYKIFLLKKFFKYTWISQILKNIP